MASRNQNLTNAKGLIALREASRKACATQLADLRRAESATPKRVYSENNGAGYLTRLCPCCGEPFRQIESRGATPGSMAVKVTDAQGKVQWFLPLNSEYMLHNKRSKPASERELAFTGKPQVWILPGTSRKAIKVQGPCQAVKLAKVPRKSKCSKCYSREMREIAQGIRIYDNAATIKVRKAGNPADVRMVRQRIDAETRSLAAIHTAKRVSVHKPRRSQPAIPTQATQYNEPRLFGAYLIRDGESFKGYAEARTISEARKMLAVSLGIDLADMAGRNIYVVLPAEYGHTVNGEEWKRVA